MSRGTATVRRGRKQGRKTARAQRRGQLSLYVEVTAGIVAELEEGRVPWVQPWGTPASQLQNAD